MSGFADVVLGLQFGSEGKGAFCYYLLESREYAASVRTGGPQAGHNIKLPDEAERAFHALPVAAAVPDVSLYISPGGVVAPDTLLNELAWCDERGLAASARLMVDGFATVLEEMHGESEEQAEMQERLGSTQLGVGAATAERVWRRARIAGEDSRLQPFVGDTVTALADAAAPTLVETTQGYGLGLITSGFYPKVTSREISTAQALSDCGLSPQSLRETIGVARTHPIRVSGNSGPLQHETTWEVLGVAPEVTTTTKRERRVGRWEPEVVQRACRVCGVDSVALAFVDYLDTTLRGEASWDTIEQKVGARLREMQTDVPAPIQWVATGFGTYVEVPEDALM